MQDAVSKIFRGGGGGRTIRAGGQERSFPKQVFHLENIGRYHIRGKKLIL